MKNHIIIRIWDAEMNACIRAFEGDPTDVSLFKDNVTDCFVNQSGGITIMIDVTSC